MFALCKKNHVLHAVKKDTRACTFNEIFVEFVWIQYFSCSKLTFYKCSKRTCRHAGSHGNMTSRHPVAGFFRIVSSCLVLTLIREGWLRSTCQPSTHLQALGLCAAVSSALLLWSTFLTVHKSRLCSILLFLSAFKSTSLCILLFWKNSNYMYMRSQNHEYGYKHTTALAWKATDTSYPIMQIRLSITSTSHIIQEPTWRTLAPAHNRARTKRC